jgi:hypothetical protein
MTFDHLVEQALGISLAKVQWSDGRNLLSKLEPSFVERDFGLQVQRESVNSAAWLDRVAELMTTPDTLMIEHMVWRPDITIIMEG